jgi:hypothetical protein
MYALAWTDVVHQIAKIVTVPDESVREIITHHRQQQVADEKWYNKQ